MSVDSRVRKLWRPLAADIRQALVSWLVLLAVPVVGAILLAALIGTVPAWMLALAIAAGAVLVAAISIEHRRELGRVEGELALEREGHNNAKDALANLQLNIPGGSATDDIERGLLFRIQALRGEMETRLTTRNDTTSSQDRALANLAVDVSAYLGETKTVEDIARQWRNPAFGIGAHDAITALGQLEGMVMGGPAPS